MNLSNVLRWVNIFVCVLLLTLSGCKNTPDESIPILHIDVTQSVLVEGDSLVLQLLANNKPVSADSWTATLGVVNTAGKWVAPSHIAMDTMLATIKATYQKQQSTVQLKIMKKAFKQALVSYAQTIKPLLANNCNFSGCHANGSRGGKVELSVYDSVKTSVFPFNADASKLYFSLIKTDPLRVMPPAGKLHADKIQSVWLWIEQGALNN